VFIGITGRSQALVLALVAGGELVGQQLGVEPGLEAGLDALSPLLELHLVEGRTVLLAALVRQAPGGDQGPGVDAELGVPQRTLGIAELGHHLTQLRSARHQAPHDGHAIGVQVHEVERVSSPPLVDAARELLPVGHAPGEHPGVRVRLLDGRVGPLEHLSIVLAAVEHGHSGLDAGTEEIREARVHLVPELPEPDGGIAGGHVRHEAREALVARFAVGPTGPGRIAVDDDQQVDAALLCALHEAVPLGQVARVVSARLGGVLHQVPVERLADEPDAQRVQEVELRIGAVVHADPKLGAVVVDPQLAGVAEPHAIGAPALLQFGAELLVALPHALPGVRARFLLRNGGRGAAQQERSGQQDDGSGHGTPPCHSREV